MSSVHRGTVLGALLVCINTGMATANAAAPSTSQSQTMASADAAFNPRDIFAPFAMANPVNRYRSAAGVPGPDYWQNRADYQLDARLDSQAKTLAADETIVYTNHSPDALHELWLYLPQNRYRRDARANVSEGTSTPPAADHTQGMQLDEVSASRDGRSIRPHTQVVDTRLRLALAQPLAANGGQITLHIHYHYTIPAQRFGGRNGWAPTPHGDIFDIAQWYPRMAVYDDIRGWNTAPFLNQEFYTEFGDFDYRITAPADMLVLGSGELTNADTLLSSATRDRLATARHSDTVVTIRSAADVAASRPAAPGATRTWQFHMDNTRDVAFAASRAFIWDALKLDRDTPDAKRPAGLAMAVYPPSAAGDGAWGRAAEYTKHAIENFAQRWAPYPFSNAVAVGGPVDGMEYPGIVFDSQALTGKTLFSITAHEFGHAWFPMLVGSDERRHAWMDEGMNTFIDVLAQQDFNQGEYAPKRDAEFAPDDGPDAGTPTDQIVALLRDEKTPAILTRTDLIPEAYRHPLTYFKAALGMKLLRDEILGPKRFDAAFKQYIATWSYKHPQPGDFFRMMDSAAGEDLSWFWRGWFAHNWALDLAVTDIQTAPAQDGTADEAPPNTRITVANRDRLVLPATLRVWFADGQHVDRRIPVATWMQHRQFTIGIDDTRRVTAAEIDPDHALPDVQRDNNRTTMSQ